MSNSVFQGVIVQLREMSDRTFGIIDNEGSVISCTDGSLLGEKWSDAVVRVLNSSERIVTFGQKTFKSILSSAGFLEYAVFCNGDDEAAKAYCQRAYIAFNDARVSS